MIEKADLHCLDHAKPDTTAWWKQGSGYFNRKQVGTCVLEKRVKQQLFTILVVLTYITNNVGRVFTWAF